MYYRLTSAVSFPWHDQKINLWGTGKCRLWIKNSTMITIGKINFWNSIEKLLTWMNIFNRIQAKFKQIITALLARIYNVSYLAPEVSKWISYVSTTCMSQQCMPSHVIPNLKLPLTSRHYCCRYYWNWYGRGRGLRYVESSSEQCGSFWCTCVVPFRMFNLW